MEQFLGEFPLKLDEKGRMLLPAKFRASFAEGIAISRGPDECLHGYRMPDFLERLKKFQEAPGASRAARRRTRMFASATADQTPDSQGRVLVPPTLRDYAGLSREVMVAGCGTYIEIWDSQKWAAEIAEAEIEFAAMDDPEGGF